MLFKILMVQSLLWGVSSYGTKSNVSPGDRSSLAELPLDKLLHVKQAIAANSLEEGDENSSSDDSYKMDVLALRTNLAKKKKKKYKEPPLRRDDWDDSYSWKGGKGKGDIQTIFQTTVTVLAFLAFGGYLLCLIIQTVRGTTNMTVTTTAAPAANGGRRKRRAPLDPLDGFHYTLLAVSEAYAKYEALNRANP